MGTVVENEDADQLHLVEIDLLDADVDPDAVAQTIDAALRKDGFFFVRNHGVDECLLMRMWKYTEAFHALPIDEKEALKKPEKTQLGYVNFGPHARYENVFPESSELGGLNQWPDEYGEVIGFRETCQQYAEAVNVFGKRLLQLLERGMGVDNGTLTDGFKQPQGALNLRHYKSVASGNKICCVKPHTDSGVLTFLPQQAKPGFEVCTSTGQWVRVSAPKENVRDISTAGNDQDQNDNETISTCGTTMKTDSTWFLVQAGDCLRRWTNHRYVSALHRVCPLPQKGDRYAMPYFWGPSEGYVMRTLLTSGEKNEKDLYKPVTFVEYERAIAEARERGTIMEISTLASLTAAQIQAARENVY